MSTRAVSAVLSSQSRWRADTVQVEAVVEFTYPSTCLFLATSPMLSGNPWEPTINSYQATQFNSEV